MYRVDFNISALVEKCIKEICTSVVIASAKFEYKKVKVAVTEAQLETFDEQSKIQYYQNRNFQLPDIVTYLASSTNLTRKTIVQILLGLGDKLEAFKNNPQRFIELASEVIRKQMRLAIIDGITYHRIGDEAYYAQELFQEEELTGYLKNMVAANKSVMIISLVIQIQNVSLLKNWKHHLMLSFMQNSQIGSELIPPSEVTIPIGRF